MPAPAKTSDAEIVAAAKRIVERSGIEALSMQAVAEAVDVRPPSLYKRFADRDALVRTVQRLAFEDLRAAIERVPSGLPAIERLSRMADAYRGFARKHRRLYSAMFYETAGRAPEEAAMRTAAAEPLLRAVASVVGESASLPAARQSSRACGRRPARPLSYSAPPKPASSSLMPMRCIGSTPIWAPPRAWRSSFMVRWSSWRPIR